MKGKPRLTLMTNEPAPLSLRKCRECNQDHWMPDDDYDICTDCYFELARKAGQENAK